MNLDRLLVIRLSSIGDVVLTTPLVRRLRAKFPNAEIHFLTKPAFAPLVLYNPNLTKVFAPETFNKASFYDICIDLQHNGHSAQLRPHAHTTFRYRKENWKKFLLVNFKVNLYSGYTSTAERYINAVAPLGLADDNEGCEIFLDDASKAFAAKQVEQNSNRPKPPVLAVAYGARHFTKRFPAERFSSVLNRLLEKYALEIWLLGGKEDSTIGEEIYRSIAQKERVKNFAGTCSLLESAALIEHADAMLCNDTGLMHIAAAFQKPIVALFGSSVAEFGFLPYRSPHSILEVKNLTCRPCSHIGRDRCPEKHFRCMTDIDDERIIAAVKTMLRIDQ